MSTALDKLMSGQGSDVFGTGGVYLGDETIAAPTPPGKSLLFPDFGKPPAATGPVTKAKYAPVNEAKNLIYKLSIPELDSFVNELKSYGYDNANRTSALSLWEMAVDGAASWRTKSGNTQNITPKQYLQWYSKGTQKKKEPIPQKEVYLYDKPTIKGLIDDTLVSVLGRSATKDENKQFYTAIRAMIDEGTVRTTETVTDPKTGKKTQVSTTTPGFTKEAASAMIEKELKANSNQDYLEKKSLDFGDFLSQLGG